MKSNIVKLAAFAVFLSGGYGIMIKGSQGAQGGMQRAFRHFLASNDWSFLRENPDTLFHVNDVFEATTVEPRANKLQITNAQYGALSSLATAWELAVQRCDVDALKDILSTGLTPNTYAQGTNLTAHMPGPGWRPYPKVDMPALIGQQLFGSSISGEKSSCAVKMANIFFDYGWFRPDLLLRSRGGTRLTLLQAALSSRLGAWQPDSALTSEDFKTLNAGLMQAIVNRGVRLSDRNSEAENTIAWVMRVAPGTLKPVVLTLLRAAYGGDRQKFIDDLCKCNVDQLLEQKNKSVVDEEQRQAKGSNVRINDVNRQKGAKVDLEYLKLLKQACIARDVRDKLAAHALWKMLGDPAGNVTGYIGPVATKEFKRVVHEHDEQAHEGLVNLFSASVGDEEVD